MNSFSHYAFGAVMEWAYRTLAGIDTLEPGHGRILIRPRIPSRGSNPGATPIEWVKADYDGPRGPISSHWKREGDSIVMAVMIPANTAARVHVPAQAAADVTEGGRPLAAAPGVKVVGVEEGAVVLDVGSGTYRFVARE